MPPSEQNKLTVAVWIMVAVLVALVLFTRNKLDRIEEKHQAEQRVLDAVRRSIPSTTEDTVADPLQPPDRPSVDVRRVSAPYQVSAPRIDLPPGCLLAVRVDVAALERLGSDEILRVLSDGRPAPKLGNVLGHLTDVAGLAGVARDKPIWLFLYDAGAQGLTWVFDMPMTSMREFAAAAQMLVRKTATAKGTQLSSGGPRSGPRHGVIDEAGNRAVLYDHVAAGEAYAAWRNVHADGPTFRLDGPFVARIRTDALAAQHAEEWSSLVGDMSRALCGPRETTADGALCLSLLQRIGEVREAELACRAALGRAHFMLCLQPVADSPLDVLLLTRTGEVERRALACVGWAFGAAAKAYPAIGRLCGILHEAAERNGPDTALIISCDLPDRRLVVVQVSVPLAPIEALLPIPAPDAGNDTPPPDDRNLHPL